jgi:hypothetical protein
MDRFRKCANGISVDICITTDWKEMEGVCIIADLLARSEHLGLFVVHG